ncbi:MAG: hypothetical protein ACX93I_04595 [Winogradskyella sp.]|jgi:hypothetical protein
MNKYFKYLFITMLFAAFSCEDENGVGDSSNYLGFEFGPLSANLVENSTSTFDVKVYTGNIVGSDRTFNIAVNEDATQLDASNYSIPATVTVPGGDNVGSFTVNFTDNDNLGFVAQDLVLMFQDGQAISVGNDLTIEVAQECLDTLVNLSLSFDDWAEECTWEIYDLSGTPAVIFSGGSGGEYDALDNSSINFNFCLPAGNYGIVVYDAYGDGGTDYVVSANGSDLASGTVPGGNPANVPTQTSATFTVN